MSKRTDPAVEAQMAADYSRGDGSVVIAARYGVDPVTVRKALRRVGVPLRSHAESMRTSGAVRGKANQLLTTEQNQQAALWYSEGVLVEDIAASLGSCPATAYKAIRRAGAKVRPPYRDRTYTLDESAFDADPPGEKAAYFAGLLLTDGSVSGNDITLALTLGDRALVEQFAGFLGTDKPVRAYPSSSGHQPYCRLMITSARLAAAVSRFGVVPKKTLTASAPDFITHDRHFWRGCVDGDGWVTFMNRSDGSDPAPLIGLCGTKRLVEQFEEYARSVVPDIAGGRVKPNAGPNCWRVDYHCQKAIALARVLYGNCTAAMPRKQAKAEAFLALPDLYTVREVAKLLGVHKGTVAARGHSGAIPGGVVRATGRLAGFHRDMIDGLIAQRGA